MQMLNHRTLWGPLALILLVNTGCRFISLFNRNDAMQAVQISEMPRVSYTDMDATGRRLAAAGFRVIISRPELQVKKASGEIVFVLPALVETFEAGRWNHLVAEHEPPSGTALKPGATVTLIAGIHHGAGPFRPWLEAHGGSVRARGETRCRDCHAQQYCAVCHARLRP